MATGWIARIDERDYPADSAQTLRTWAQEGRLKASDYVFNPTLQRWMYAREAEELKGHFTVVTASAPPVPHGSTHICTMCGQIGRPVSRVKGSFLVELILWLLFIIPGLVYSLWRLTSRYQACPRCGQPAMIPLNTPEGQRRLVATTA